MKNVFVKISFYARKFGLGIYLEKMPMVYSYKYKLTLQCTWLECCILIIKK